jgi:uncharacterized protein (DUF2062 family)
LQSAAWSWLARPGMSRPPGRFAAAVRRLRTEGDTPARQAWAVGLGAYIGASPFIGLHLLLTLVVGRLFRLNRLKMYLAANISNPFVAPLLYAVEIQVGAWLRMGHMYSPATLHQVRLQGIAIDILIGSVVVGLALAVIGGSLTYWVVSGHGHESAVVELIEAAAAPYLAAGIAVWEIARSKLRLDPVYTQILKDGVLPADGRLVDLGCGQGLMLSLISASAARFRAGTWPESWPAPPLTLELHGIELRPRIAQQARDVLNGIATIEERDVTTVAIPSCEALLLVDVLHLLSRAAQDRLLDDVARALAPTGVLVIREANAAGGWRFALVRIGNRLNAIVQGRWSRRFQFDSAAGWRARLTQSGFDVARLVQQQHGLANFLIYARPGNPSGAGA